MGLEDVDAKAEAGRQNHSEPCPLLQAFRPRWSCGRARHPLRLPGKHSSKIAPVFEHLCRQDSKSGGQAGGSHVERSPPCTCSRPLWPPAGCPLALAPMRRTRQALRTPPEGTAAAPAPPPAQRLRIPSLPGCPQADLRSKFQTAAEAGSKLGHFSRQRASPFRAAHAGTEVRGFPQPPGRLVLRINPALRGTDRPQGLGAGQSARSRGKAGLSRLEGASGLRPAVL